MGCGSSIVLGLDSEQLAKLQADYRRGPLSQTEVSGVYHIQSGSQTHTLLVHSDGRIIVDGQFAKSVVYKYGRKEFSFAMAADSAVTHGEIRFSNTTTINGVFYTKDDSSYVISGSLDKGQDVTAVKGAGRDSVVIDQRTLKRYKEIEKQMERYQDKELLLPNIMDMTLKAQTLERNIQSKVSEIEGMKTELKKSEEENGGDSEDAKALEIELESKCLALASDQHEYENMLKNIRTCTGDLFDYNILSEEFDELLSVMFGGDNGSDIENQLEQMVDELEEAQMRHEESYDKEERLWEDAKNCCSLVMQALHTWSSLQQDGLEDKKRLFLAKQTRSILVLLIEGLVNIEVALESDVSFSADVECREMLIEFKAKIYHMYNDRVDEGVNIIMTCKDRTRKLEQWIYDKYRIQSNLDETETLRNTMLETKLKLKHERRDLIQTWLAEHVGQLEDEEEEAIVPTENGDDENIVDMEIVEGEKPMTDAPFNIATSYEQIVSDMKAREQKAELAGIRADLELQSKIRDRRRRQRHQRKQKLMDQVAHS